MSATIPADRRRSTAPHPLLGPGDRAPAPAARHPGVVGLVRPGQRPARGRGSHCRHDLLLLQPTVPDEPALRLAGPVVQPAALLRDGLGPGLGGEALAAVRPMVRASSHRFPGDLARAHGPLSPRIYPMAWAILALGASLRLALVPGATRDRVAPAAAPELPRPAGLGRRFWPAGSSAENGWQIGARPAARCRPAIRRTCC